MYPLRSTYYQGSFGFEVNSAVNNNNNGTRLKDANGNVVYGGKELGDDGFSNLFWDVTI